VAEWGVVKADAADFLAALEPGSADLIFCSPPYEKARLYLENGEDMGIARGTEEWVAWMVGICEAARRACRGLCAFVVEGQTRNYRYSCSPFLLVADLHRRGFHLRKPPVYRRVGIPGSGGPDWLRNDYEPIICFTNGGKLPWSENTACGAPPKYEPGGDMSYRSADGTRKSATRRTGSFEYKTGRRNGKGDRQEGIYQPPEVANPGNVIYVPVGGGLIGNQLAHDNEAPFPEKLAEFFVRSFCPPGGLVVDCFAGSGTTLAVAVRHGRRAFGCDLRQSQVDLATRRISNETPLALYADG
jgi:hypothetical protein